MPKLLKIDNGDISLQPDDWNYAAASLPPPESARTVPPRSLLAADSWYRCTEDVRTELAERTDFGIWLASDQTPDEYRELIPKLQLIAIHFPALADGRGFSTARLLKDRCHFNAELRAFGNYLNDQLFYMKRCGFNSFSIDSDISEEQCQQFLQTFDVSYQGALDEPLPLYKRQKLTPNKAG